MEHVQRGLTERILDPTYFAFLEYAVDFSPAASSTLQLETGLLELLTESIRGLPPNHMITNKSLIDIHRDYTYAL